MQFEEIKSQNETTISGYGDGGFRLGEQKLDGSLLLTPKGYYPWDVRVRADITPESLKVILDMKDDIEFLIIGMGEKMMFADKTVRQAFETAGIGLEVMDTGAAARTYNVLLQEGRRVAAALIAI